MKKIRENNWILSLVINAVILLTIVICTTMVYETNDDYAISVRIADGYPFVGFVNYYLCKLLIAIQSIAEGINVYVIWLLITSFAAFVCILKILFDAGENAWFRIVSTAIIAMFSLDHYCLIQFSKTAALLMIAGLLMMVDAVIRKRKAGYYIASIILLYLGATIRIDALPAALGFVGIYALLWILLNRKKVVEDGYFTGKKIVLYIVLLVIVAGAYGIDVASCRKNVSTDELRYAEDYSVYRSNIVDYPTYQYYESNKEKYAEIGMSENDIYLISHWYFDYDGAASFDNLRKIDNIKRTDESRAEIAVRSAKKCVKDIKKGIGNRNNTGIHIVALILLVLWALAVLKPRNWLYVLFIGGVALALYLAVYYMQRPTYRALYAADAGAAIWLLYAVMSNCESERKNFGRKSLVTSIIVTVVIICGLGFVYKNCINQYHAAEGKVISQETEDYFKANSDTVYVWDTSEKKFARNYLRPCKEPDRSDFNVVGTGGWGVLSPYMLDKLHALNMNNPIKNLISNNEAFYVGDKNVKRLQEYYNKWYSDGGNTIEIVKVGAIKENTIWKIVKKQS